MINSHSLVFYSCHCTPVACVKLRVLRHSVRSNIRNHCFAVNACSLNYIKWIQMTMIPRIKFVTKAILLPQVWQQSVAVWHSERVSRWQSSCGVCGKSSCGVQQNLQSHTVQVGPQRACSFQQKKSSLEMLAGPPDLLWWMFSPSSCGVIPKAFKESTSIDLGSRPAGQPQQRSSGLIASTGRQGARLGF